MPRKPTISLRTLKDGRYEVFQGLGAGRRHRYYFQSKTAAQRKKKQLELEREDYGILAEASLTPAERSEYIDCIRLLWSMQASGPRKQRKYAGKI